MQNLIEQINKELNKLGFEKIVDPNYLASYKKEKEIQTQGPTMVINGRPVQSQPNIINREINISYYEGSMKDIKTEVVDPLLFVTFKVLDNTELVVDEEMSFYKEDFEMFKNVLNQINI